MAHLINKDTLENILRELWKEDDGKTLMFEYSNIKFE